MVLFVTSNNMSMSDCKCLQKATITMKIIYFKINFFTNYGSDIISYLLNRHRGLFEIIYRSFNFISSR